MDEQPTTQPSMPAPSSTPEPVPVAPPPASIPPVVPKKSSWPLTITLIAVLILGYGVLAWSANLWPFSTNPEVAVSLSPSVSAIPDTTTGWKTYTNAQYGFEFKYPSDPSYETIDRKTTNYIIGIVGGVLPDGEGGSEFITVQSSAKSYTEEVARRIREKNTNDIAQPIYESDREITFANQRAHEFIYGTSIGLSVKTIVVPATTAAVVIYIVEPGGEKDINTDLILSTFKFTAASSTKNVFLSSFYNLEFTLPGGYFVESNQHGVTDATRVESFFFRKESSDYSGVPMLNVSADLKLSSGQTLQQLAKSIYDMNKNQGYTTTDLKSSNYGGVAAYEFGLQSGYMNPGGGQLLDSPGGKVVFLYKNGKVFQFLQTGADSGLTSILSSLKFK